jgi:hypothetical protein
MLTGLDGGSRAWKATHTNALLKYFSCWFLQLKCWDAATGYDQVSYNDLLQKFLGLMHEGQKWFRVQDFMKYFLTYSLKKITQNLKFLEKLFKLFFQVNFSLK